MSSHYSVFVLLGTKAAWQRIAATLHGSVTESVVDQQTNSHQHSQEYNPSIVCLFNWHEKWRITFQSLVNKVFIDLIKHVICVAV